LAKRVVSLRTPEKRGGAMPANDLWLRAARRERTERTPVWLMRQAGRFDPAYQELRERYGLPLEELFCHVDAAAEISLLPRRFGVDAIIFFQDILTLLTPMGRPFVFRPGPQLAEPVRTAQDVDGLRRYDPADALDFVPKCLASVRNSLAGDLPLLGFAGAPVTLAFFLIEGTSPQMDGQNARAMMEQEPTLFRRLVDFLTAATIEYLQLQIESGVDALQVFESVADLLTPEQYAAFAHPSHERLFSELGKRVPAILFCKDYAPLDLMASSGADVLSVASSVDLADAITRYGDRVAFQGNVDHTILRDGTPEDVERAVVQCVRAGGHAGHILNLGHGVLKETPVENVQRFIDTAKRIRLPMAADAANIG